jgi:predicted GNAT family acetyltransferase
MTDLPKDLFTYPIWTALHTRHRHFSLSNGDACCYPAEVAPFAAVSDPTVASLRHLHSLLTPAQSVWLAAEVCPRIPELTLEATLPCLQLVLPEEITPPPTPAFEIVPLTCEHAHEMVALTDIAFPGLFRSRTYTLGNYFGIRIDGQLIAMAGERFSLCGYREISAVCTHPEHTGHGYAARLIHHVIADQRTRGLKSMLHVAANNARAIALYERLGFVKSSEIFMYKLMRE